MSWTLRRGAPYSDFMKRIFLALAIAFLSLNVSAAAITSISPPVGTVSGGDTIVITFDTPLHSCQICSPPVALAAVTFGGVPARLISGFGNTIFAVTPPHAAGTVAIAVSSADVPYGTAQFTFAGWGGPISQSNYERILVPLALPAGRIVSGAFGSQWTTEMWVSNRSEFAVELFNDVSCTVVCPQFLVADPPYPQLAAKSVTKVEPLDAGGGVAFVYYLQKTYANDVSFSLHVADVSRSKENAGTELGVVREHDFRGPEFDILNVPIDDLSRAALRVYDPDSHDGISADVSVYSMTTGALLGSTTVTMQLPVARAATTNALVVPPFATFAQLADLRAAFPSLTAGRVRINIQLRGTAHGWAFVSVTNNATQLITTYRPE
jgi:hypothetical protein